MYNLSNYRFSRFGDRQGSDISYIRILHAVPNAPAVDVYANEKLIAQNLSYRGFTVYTPVPAGRYNISILPTGQTTSPVLNTTTEISPRTIYTVAATGLLPEISLFPVVDPVMPKTPGKAMVRFVHLSPNAPAVDIRLPDGTILFSNVSYRQVTNYIPVNQGEYILEARPTGTNQVVLYVPNISLQRDNFYTVYAVGLAGGSPPLQVLIPLDGNTYISV